MSKRDLKKYVNELSKEQLEEQLLELYDKFKDVKVYYDFVFNPKENELIKEAKLKISSEYFPLKNKRPKMRRSVAQKFIKHFITLGVDCFLIADVMLYHIEIAQALLAEKEVKSEAFFKSMFNSFDQLIHFLNENAILASFKNRVVAVAQISKEQKWPNYYQFETIIERLDY